MNLREYRRKSGQVTGPNRPIISVFLIAALIVISLPLTVASIINWYKFVPLVFLFSVLTVFLGWKAYQGLINRHVKIFPKGGAQIYNEAKYIGGKASNYATGAAAQVAGAVFLLLGIISFSLVVKYLMALINELV